MLSICPVFVNVRAQRVASVSQTSEVSMDYGMKLLDPRNLCGGRIFPSHDYRAESRRG